MSFKKSIRKIHLWLGLSSGLVVFIVSITGCLYVFQKEISSLYYHDVLYVDVPKNTSTLPISELIKKAELEYGKQIPVRTATSFKQADKAWEFMFFKAGPEDAITYFEAIEYYDAIYINPYTGAVTGKIDYKYNFFSLVKYMHWSLLLSTPYGQPIVGYATLIFVVMLISGIILWWPKNLKKSNFNKSFKVKWSAKFKRLNYDLHNVAGFYASFVLLLLALTGMVWTFKWFQATVYVVAAQSTTAPEQIKLSSNLADSSFKSIQHPLDMAYHTAKIELIEADRLSVLKPANPEATIRVTGYRGKEVYYNQDQLHFDQYTGKRLHRKNFTDANNGEKIIAMNYDIHVGAILGLPGKILAFIASLISSSLPITGFMIWWGRRNKKAKSISTQELITA